MDADFIRDLFSDFGPVQVRRMFGGAGLYADGVMFGLVVRDVIYLKADPAGTAAFQAEGGAPFQFETKAGRQVLTSYWRLPARLYDEPEELARWAQAALGVATRARLAKTVAKKTVAKKKRA